MKYAFPDKSAGRVVIELKEKASILYLSVSDNGIGRSDNTIPSGTGFGTQLIQLLTQQLDGRMRLNHQSGLSVSFEFHHNKAA